MGTSEYFLLGFKINKEANKLESASLQNLAQKGY